MEKDTEDRLSARIRALEAEVAVLRADLRQAGEVAGEILDELEDYSPEDLDPFEFAGAARERLEVLLDIPDRYFGSDLPSRARLSLDDIMCP